VRTFQPRAAVIRLTRLRLIEIGVALALTVAALLFVVMTVWAAEPAGVSVAGAWARPTLGPVRTTAAYMAITNKGQEDDTLMSAQSALAKSVELHQTTMTADGVMQMREIEDGLPIAAGETVTLAPGGTHLMVMGLAEALAAGDMLPLTLAFAKAGPVELVVPVRAAGPEGAGAHHH